MTVQLVALDVVPADDLLAVLNDPRLARHMPLWSAFDPAGLADWIEAKQQLAVPAGLGPRAVLLDGDCVGWAGLQPEPYGLDLAVVLAPRAWGAGQDVVRQLLADAAAAGIEQVQLALPPSRRVDGWLARHGWQPTGEADGFRVFRLDLSDR